MRGAPATIASVMPVSTWMKAGMGALGRTSVWNSPSTCPPRTLTAPTSVIAEAEALPPVVSRSTTTNVTPANAVPSSSSVPWTAFMSETVCRATDRPRQARLERPSRAAGQAVSRSATARIAARVTGIPA